MMFIHSLDYTIMSAVDINIFGIEGQVVWLVQAVV